MGLCHLFKFTSCNRYHLLVAFSETIYRSRTCSPIGAGAHEANAHRCNGRRGWCGLSRMKHAVRFGDRKHSVPFGRKYRDGQSRHHGALMCRRTTICVSSPTGEAEQFLSSGYASILLQMLHHDHILRRLQSVLPRRQTRTPGNTQHKIPQQQ